MIIDNIISGIDVGGPKSYYSFETFVQHLFKHHIEKQNKTFQIHEDRFGYGDAIAPEGFDSFEGRTIIEIKFNLATGSIKVLLEKLANQFLNEYLDKSFKTLLVVSAKLIPVRVINRLESELESHQLPFEIIFWGPVELNKIAVQHRKVVNTIANNLFSLRLETAISKPPKNWKQEREEIVESLKDCYKKGQFSLLLGAGVSSSAGMPDWNTLLNSLFVTYLTQEFNGDIAIGDQDISELVSRLNKIDEPSALMAARYLRKGLSKRNSEAKEFISAVTKNLYRLRNSDRDIDSELIKSISSMCLPRRTGAKVRATASKPAMKTVTYS